MLMLAGMLGVHAALLAWSAIRHSPTFDEPSHMLAGIRAWQFGTFEIQRVNPPLVRMLATLPVLFARPATDWSHYRNAPGVRPEFLVREDFIRANGRRLFFLFSLARWACIPFSLLGGYICYRWANELFGDPAGLMALGLWCFSPNILAYGQLINSDVAAASLGLAAAYAFRAWLRQATYSNVLVAGTALGLAQLTKTTWIVLYALWPVLWLMCNRQPWTLDSNRSDRRWRLCRELRQLGIALALSLVVLNLGYGFEGSFRKLGSYRFVSAALGGLESTAAPEPTSGNRFAGTWLAAVPIPLPENYLLGIDVQKRDFERGCWSYLAGQWRLQGWWYYYFYALAVKVPLGAWLLIALAVTAYLSWPRFRTLWREDVLLLAPVATVFTLVSSQTGFTIHLRYLLPIFPFVIVWTSRVGRAFVSGNRPLAAAVAVSLTWTAAASLWCYPHTLSYFNELAGGPRGGRFHLLDSNIDWGQDLLYLERWAAQHPEARPLHVAYWVRYIDPQAVGIVSGPVSDRVPTPGWAAISVQNLHGRDRRYRYFLRFTPVATAGYSIYIYHITPGEADRVRRELGLPPLQPARAERKVAWSRETGHSGVARSQRGVSCPPGKPPD